MSGCQFCAIDVHTHVVPGHFPAYLGRADAAAWPSMAEAQPCHRHVMLAGKVYRTVSDRAWDGSLRLQDMDELGLGRQVLSPMPELLSYWMDLEDASKLLRFINEEIAAMVAGRPERFHGLGAVPLQDIDAAIRELDYLINTLGMSGIEIAGNINGKPIGDPCFDAFWAAVEDLDAAVFVHPLRPVGMNRLVGPGALQQLLAFPSETGLAAASLLTGGVIERHPRLRIAFSHGGGTLGSLLPRLQHGWNSNPAVRAGMSIGPKELARRLYFDSLVYDTDAIALLLQWFGNTQIMIGSDYPFNIRDKDPVGRIDQLALPQEVRALLTHENALRWLGAGSQAGK